MTAIRYVLRAELRTAWRSVLALGLVIGLAGGAVLTFAAGARRTDSAYRRFLVEQHAYDVLMRVDVPGSPLTAARVRRLPGVREVAPAGAFFLIAFGAGVGVLVPPDERIGTEINTFKMLEGHRPDPRDATEAVVSFTLADQYHLEVGDTIQVLPDDVLGPPPADADPDEVAALLPARDRVLALLPRNELTIVGIEASPGEFPPQIEGSGRYLVHTSPALHPVQDDLALFSEAGHQVMVRLDGGSNGTREFLEAVRRVAPTNDLGVQADLSTGVNRSLHTQAVAFALMALLTALAALLIFSQLVARFLASTQSNMDVLAALGMRRTGRSALGVARALVAGLVAAPVALVVAASASELFPTGLARTAEPDPGLRPDGLVLAVGLVAIPLVVGLLAAWPAWRVASTSPDRLLVPGRRSWWERFVSRLQAPAPLDIGIRMAFPGRQGSRGAAGTTSLFAVALGIAALVGALIFGASLSHLLSTPALYGKSWDAALTTYDPLMPREGVPVLREDPRVTGVGVGRLRAAFSVDGRRVDGIAVDTVDGALGPTMLEGRRPQKASEIVLGSRTLRSLDRNVGDTVAVTPFASNREPVRMRIVGRAVFPLFSELGRLGDGAYVSRAAWQRVTGSRLRAAESVALVRLAPGVALGDVVDDLQRQIKDPYGIAVISQGKPTDIVNFGRVESTPYVLGALLALVSLTTLAYILVSSVRRRRRELAVLKTLGFVRRQVRVVIAGQATTVAALALLVGIPIGVALGRFAWTRFADDLGIVTVNVVSVPTIVVSALAVLVVANLVAAVPATLAGRTRPADALRTE